ncbi:MAG: TolC family protein [Aeoliella sp.]
MNKFGSLIFPVAILVLHNLVAGVSAQRPVLVGPELVPTRLPPPEPLLEEENTPVLQDQDRPFLGSAGLPTVEGDDWWAGLVAQPQRPGCQSLPVTLHELAVETIAYSQEVQALRVGPQIRRTQVTQADAEFDPIAFIDGKWFDRDEPVGSFLATGGKPRLLEETFTENIGFRRKTRSGASVEIAQRLGFQDSNSDFFIPADQAQSRFAISLTQPLLRGAGRAFNENLIVQAELDVRIADDVFSEGLQDRLLRVAQQYWRLYFQRALVLQQDRNLRRARAIQIELESREGIDAVRSQIERAKAQVARREAALMRAQAEVRNAESTLQSLVNSPALWADPCGELTPMDIPRADHITIPPQLARQIALTKRPKIDNLVTQIRSASVRYQVAQNQVLPALALVVDTYVNGLQGGRQLGKSLGDQFSKGAPSYSAGLVFEVPIGNRRARAQLRQRQLELHRLYSQLHSAMAELAAEVDIALREVEVTYAELGSRRASLAATALEVDYLYHRWRRLPGHDQSASLFLEDLLDAEDRLVNEEERLAAAQTGYAVAQVELKRTLGELVVCNPCDLCVAESEPTSAPPNQAPLPTDPSAYESAEPVPAPAAQRKAGPVYLMGPPADPPRSATVAGGERPPLFVPPR